MIFSSTKEEIINLTLLYAKDYGPYFTMSMVAFASGAGLVKFLRQLCAKSNNRLQFSWVPIVFPILTFLILNLLSFLSIFPVSYADSLTLGLLLGILYALSRKPEASRIRLVVHLEDGKSEEILLGSVNVSIAEVKETIATVLNISPSIVNIESGKGKFFEDSSKPLLPLILGDSPAVDLFGFITAVCYVSISDDDLSDTQEVEEDDDDTKVHRRAILTRMLPGHRPHIKYGGEINLFAKIANAANDINAFELSSIDGYGAASPVQHSSQASLAYMQEQAMALLQSSTQSYVTFVGWRDEEDDGSSVMSGRSTLYSKLESSQSGQNIKDGDCIVIGTDGKFMTVVRGWWIAWSSNVPRRSGAFRVEIVEKATINTMQQGISAVKGMISGNVDKEKDAHMLRAGDVFRLKSVKFPEYELAITGKKIKDNAYHLGLRRIDQAALSGSDNWCMPLRFTAKDHFTIFDSTKSNTTSP